MAKGARTTGMEQDTKGAVGPLEAGQRWSATRNREVSVETACLERWKVRPRGH